MTPGSRERWSCSSPRDGFAALEQPAPDTWVVRRLGERAEADRFIQDRLAQYERMWDGCGCRIDYYS